MTLKIYKVCEILDHLESCIKDKKPFSLLRFGDGGIKMIHAILYNDSEQLNDILRREGIPKDLVLEVFELWGFYARRADYIDTPEVYFSNQFWPRLKKPPDIPMSKKTIEKLFMWKDLYSSAEFDNNNYCNPETNYLMIIRRPKRKNLLDVMRNKKLCFITTRTEVSSKFDNCKIDTFRIVNHYENHYEKSFRSVIHFIEENANYYDFWLVAAGELGRIYSGLIKQKGGRTIDIGFVVDYWIDGSIPIRMRKFVRQNSSNPLELRLNPRALKYSKYI